MNIKIIMQMLDKEILWCEKNPYKNLSKEYQKGFINGLIQSKHIITQISIQSK